MTSPIRLVVSDVDGTLVDKEKNLTPATADAVRRLGEAGVGFTVISARPRSGVMSIADTLGIDAPMAAFNGGLIFRRDGTVDEHHVVDAEAAAGVLAMAREEPVEIWVFADDRWHATSDEGLHADRERLSANQEPIVTADGDFDALMDKVDKLTLVSDDPAVLARLTERARAAHAGQATIAQSQTYYLDVTALEANKGAGVAALAAALDVPLDAVAALGDQQNDVPMLSIAGLSVAMGNAPDPVKAGAAHVTRSNDDDGVAYAIDHIILPRKGN